MLRIKKEKDKNRYKSSQLPQRNYIRSLRCSELKFFSTVLVFLKLDEMNTRFEPRDVENNEWTLFCQQQRIPDFPHKNTNANTKNSSRLKSPARRYVCDALLLERFRCVAFFPRGAVFEHRARFFFVRAIFVREQNE